MYKTSVYSKNLARNVAVAVNGVAIPGEDRSRIAGAEFDIVHEHHLAVLLLIDKSLHGSAVTLLRGGGESYVRGVWFMKYASKKDVEDFQGDKFKSGTFGERLRDIEKIDGSGHGGLIALKSKGWEALNSYAHAGFRPVARRFKGEDLVANYSDEELFEVERMANAFAILAVFQIAELAVNAPLCEEAERLGREFIGHYSPRIG